MAEPTVYNLTDYTEVTQYTVEGTEWVTAGKKYHPVFHGRECRPWDEPHPNPVQLYEGHVEIGWPTLTPQDDEIFDEQILSYSGLQHPVYPDAITLSDVTKTVKIGKTFTLTCSFTPAWAEFPVTWNSSDSWKASVVNWVVTGVAEGENIAITATSGYAQATCIVKVEKIAVTGITLNKDELALDTWAEETLVATIAPSDATYKWVTWSSNDSNVATVDDNWKVTAVAAGTATITATSSDNTSKKATCAVTVTDIPVTSVALDEDSISLTVGGTQQLTATVSPEDATDKTVTWSTSDGGVATVEDWLVTAVAAGTATITVTSHADNTKTDTCAITVTAPVEPGE